MSLPVVSILLPTFNRAKFLIKAIGSVQAQTFTDWELLVLDDGSTDETAQVVRKLTAADPRIRYFRFENTGCGPARVRGFNASRGKYLAFLGDDDTFFPDKLERQMEWLEKNPDAGMVYSQVAMTNPEGRVLEIWPPKPALTFETLVRQNTIQPNGVLLRRRVMEEIGTFRDDMRSCDDFEMWLRVVRHFQIGFLPMVAGNYLQHSGGMTRDSSRRVRSLMIIFRLLAKEKLSPGDRKALLETAASYSYQRAEDAAEKGCIKEALARLAARLRVNPCMGLHLPWSRYKNPVYRLIKPYGLLFILMLKTLYIRNFNHSSRVSL